MARLGRRTRSGPLLKQVMRVAVLAAVVAAASGCGKKTESEPAFARAEFRINKPRVALGSPVELTYRFTRVPGSPAPAPDRRVFVHFVDANGELMWTDDHDPSVPTSQWREGQTVEYTRSVFIPIYPYLGEARVLVGLYDPATSHRLVLEGQDVGQRAYQVGTVELLPQSENVFLIFKEGWHPAEVAQDNPAVEWQWTKKDAVLSFRNPRKDATFYLDADARPDHFSEAQQVTVSIGGQTIDQFELTSRDRVLRRIPITAAQFGEGDMVDLRIAVSHTFVPSSTPGYDGRDTRELGLRVFHAFVEPR